MTWRWWNRNISYIGTSGWGSCTYCLSFTVYKKQTPSIVRTVNIESIQGPMHTMGSNGECWGSQVGGTWLGICYVLDDLEVVGQKYQLYWYLWSGVMYLFPLFHSIQETNSKYCTYCKGCKSGGWELAGVSCVLDDLEVVEQLWLGVMYLFPLFHSI